MLLKGKMGILTHNIKGRKQLREMFKKVKGK